MDMHSHVAHNPLDHVGNLHSFAEIETYEVQVFLSVAADILTLNFPPEALLLSLSLVP